MFAELTDVVNFIILLSVDDHSPAIKRVIWNIAYSGEKSEVYIVSGEISCKSLKKHRPIFVPLESVRLEN